MREVLSYSFTSSGEENFKIVATQEAYLSEEFTLSEVGNYPNPVHSEFTTIRFQLGKQAQVTIKIYTISGELVRTLVQEKTYSKGLNEEVWDLKNDAGEKIARGVYILLVKASASEKILLKTGKIALIK
jgi:flagellar hook assembly protein FlgD